MRLAGRPPAERNALALQNVGLAISVAVRWYEATELPFEDLRQEAMLALLNAADLFDAQRGFAFSTYAHRAITTQLGKFRRRWMKSARVAGVEDIDGLSRSAAAVINEGPNLSCLSERERCIIERRYGLDGYQARTLDELVPYLGVTRSRIHQIELAALRKLRPVMARHREAI